MSTGNLCQNTALQKKSINLLQQRTAPPTFWDRTYDWVTKTARVIVIFTEAFVLIAFGWRFVLDRRLNDLKSDIESRGTVLKSLRNDEDEIKLLQSKMATYDGLWNQSSAYSIVMEEVNGYIPQNAEEIDITITNVEEEGEVFLQCSISGKAPRDEIQQLESSINNSDTFYDKKFGEIELESESVDIYNFSITAKVTSNIIRVPLGTTNETTES